MEFKLSQGCTSLVIGNCGFSAIPAIPGEREKSGLIGVDAHLGPISPGFERGRRRRPGGQRRGPRRPQHHPISGHAARETGADRRRTRSDASPCPSCHGTGSLRVLDRAGLRARPLRRDRRDRRAWPRSRPSGAASMPPTCATRATICSKRSTRPSTSAMHRRAAGADLASQVRRRGATGARSALSLAKVDEANAARRRRHPRCLSLHRRQWSDGAVLQLANDRPRAGRGHPLRQLPGISASTRGAWPSTSQPSRACPVTQSSTM